MSDFAQSLLVCCEALIGCDNFYHTAWWLSESNGKEVSYVNSTLFDLFTLATRSTATNLRENLFEIQASASVSHSLG